METQYLKTKNKTKSPNTKNLGKNREEMEI